MITLIVVSASKDWQPSVLKDCADEKKILRVSLLTTGGVEHAGERATTM